MALDKTLEDKRTALVLSKAQFTRKDNSPRSTGKLVIHQPVMFISGTLFDIFCMLYVDYGSFIFESRSDIKKWINLLSNHFAGFGLEIHIGTKKSLKNLMCILLAFSFIQRTNFTARWPRQLHPGPPEKIKWEKETHTWGWRICQVQRNSNHQIERSIFIFTKHFKQLGSYISYSLKDDYNINTHLASGNLSMGDLSKFWTCTKKA